MKKIGIAIGIFITFLIIYLLQTNFFNWFTIAGIKPNLVVILVLCVGLFVGKNIGLSMGIIIGLFLDLFIGRKIGVSAIMLGAIGLIGGYLDKTFSKESRVTVMLMVIGTTFIYEFGVYSLNAIILETEYEIWTFLRIIIIEILYNTILTIIIYPLIQRVGYKIENMFKQKNILTRYF